MLLVRPVKGRLHSMQVASNSTGAYCPATARQGRHTRWSGGRVVVPRQRSVPQIEHGSSGFRGIAGTYRPLCAGFVVRVNTLSLVCAPGVLLCEPVDV
jgi:hypothetical protein